MGFLLCIDTAVASASVCLSRGGRVTALKKSNDQRESASWIHTAIRDLLQEHNLKLQALDAIVIGEGPGSYTGLRVGMATAKGLCYASGLPLVTVNTLQMMAAAATVVETSVLLCPMIDARRMEVFTAVYNHSLDEVIPFQPMVLEDNSFTELLDKQAVCFFGNGSHKFRTLNSHPNAVFREIESDASHLAGLADAKFKEGTFASLAYTEPFYGKAFFDRRF